MKTSNLDPLRLCAVLTGAALTLAYFVLAWLGTGPRESVAMLAAGVAGFELFFFVQDVAQRRSRLNG